MAIADSGTTGHYLKSNSPCVEKQIARIPLPIRMPNGEIIQSSHTALLPQTNIPIEARKAHIFPGLKNKSLLSIGTLCDNGCKATFDDTEVIIENKENNEIVMRGTRDPMTNCTTLTSRKKL